MEAKILNYPALIVRNIIVFPYMIIPLNIGRDFSINSIEESLKKNNEIVIFTQKKINVKDVQKEDINEVGVLANIIKMLRFPDGTLRILVEASKRVKLVDFNIENTTSRAEIEFLDEVNNINDREMEALYKIGKSRFEKCLSKGLTVTPEIISPNIDIEDSGRFSDVVAAQLDIDIEDKYLALGEIDVKKRLETVNELLNKEYEILELKNKIQEKMKKGMDDSQREFFLREQLKAIQEELGLDNDYDSDLDEYKEMLESKKYPERAKEVVAKEIEKLRKISEDSSEAGLIKTYLDFIKDLPWKTYTRSSLNHEKARIILDETHYGLDEVKERILEYLSVKKISKKLRTPILCFVGPPGVGKTSIGKAIAAAMGKEFIRISLGGVRDEAEIRGHRRTYVGALAGRILRSLVQVKKSDPVFMLDEIDKLGSDFRGDPASAMLEVLDPEQNNKFADHYLEMEYDLSKIFFITTANRLDTIPRPLLDRMEIIQISGYTLNEKVSIAIKYLIPKQIEENGLTKYNISITKEAIEKIILNYTRESGVRNLEREIAKLLRKIAKKVVFKENYDKEVTVDLLENLLGISKYESTEMDSKHDVGVVTGLAWTEFGGEVLNIEVITLKGNGSLILTGKLGNVMQESAKAAMTYVRTIVEEYQGDNEYYKNYNIHIHIPEGAVPKDGPSAGITLATAIISKLTNKNVPKSIAMTGEITLTGRVLNIGGLREKLLAAKLTGIKKVLIPKGNEKDLKEISDEIKSGLNIVLVENMEDVTKEVFN